MNPGQPEHARSRIDELRHRLDGVTTLLNSVASEVGIEVSARTRLESAMESIRAVSADLVIVGETGRGDAVEHSFVDSRTSEAKSEVESGEFDMHG